MLILNVIGDDVPVASIVSTCTGSRMFFGVWTADDCCVGCPAEAVRQVDDELASLCPPTLRHSGMRNQLACDFTASFQRAFDMFT